MAQCRDHLPISNSICVSPVQCVPKKRGIRIVTNDKNELIPTRVVSGWRVCMDYRRLNKATRKDHFQLPFIDQMLDRLAGKDFYYFLVSLMDTLVTIRLQQHLKIKKRRHSHVLMTPLHFEECHLVCAMYQQPSSAA